MIIDTTVWVDNLNGVSTPQSEWLDREAPLQRLGLLDLMVCEILQGLSTNTDADRVLKELLRFEVFESGGPDLAVAAAQHYRALRGRGRTVRTTVDCLIAAFCIRDGHALLHADRDFDAFEQYRGLAVLHPSLR